MGAVMGSKNLKAVAVRPWQTLSHQGDVCYGRKSGINLRKLECRSRGINKVGASCGRRHIYDANRRAR